MKYILMNKNVEVLMFSYDKETHTIRKIEEQIHPEFAPPGIIEYKTGISRKAFNTWWRHRSIPASRTRLIDALDTLGISSSLELLERCMGLSLSDQYWVKAVGTNLQWKDINFFENPFSEDMGKLLLGQTTSGCIDVFSPDNSSDGNLLKKWKIIKGERCLIKGGNSYNNQEPYNEVIASKLYEHILKQDEFVTYTLINEQENTYSCCKTMIHTNEELVPAFYIDRMQKLRGSESLYEHYIQVCEQCKLPNVREQIDKMIVCDYILANYDRHYRNFGAIRNVETLEWERIAPLFDNGSCLWATSPTNKIGVSYKSKPFLSTPEDQVKLVKNLQWLDPIKLNDFLPIVEEVLRQNPFLEEARILAICRAVDKRIHDVIERKFLLEASFNNK